MAVIHWAVVFGLLYAFGMLVSSDDTVGAVLPCHVNRYRLNI